MTTETDTPTECYPCTCYGVSTPATTTAPAVYGDESGALYREADCPDTDAAACADCRAVAMAYPEWAASVSLSDDEAFAILDRAGEAYPTSRCLLDLMSGLIEWAAPSSTDDGRRCVIYWIFDATKILDVEPEDYDWRDMSRIEIDGDCIWGVPRS